MMLNETFRLTLHLNETAELYGRNVYYLDRQTCASLIRLSHPESGHKSIWMNHIPPYCFCASCCAKRTPHLLHRNATRCTEMLQRFIDKGRRRSCSMLTFWVR